MILNRKHPTLRLLLAALATGLLAACASVPPPTVQRGADPLAVAAAADTTRGSGQDEAAATGLEPGSVDVAVMRHVLAHNGGAEAEIVRHLADVVRPGGSVYLVDVDLTAIRQVDGEFDAIETLYGVGYRYRE